MGLMKSKYAHTSSNENITIDFREGDQSSTSSQSQQEPSTSSFSLSHLRPQFHKKHSKTRLQLLKERGRTMINKRNDKDEHEQPPPGILQKMRSTMGNLLPRFRNSQYQMAREEESAHGAVMI
jgi:hypothetical protein